ncbi:MAG: hypothetical protein M0P09_02285 [Acholeplasmataceae bacterium]|nr:hypothetical protein [Acholeplasmataceae bacterium]
MRIEELKKKLWKNEAEKRGISLTLFIETMVEGNLMRLERSELIDFLEKQENIFSKIQNNINQFARIANTSKSIDNELLIQFQQKLNEIVLLKQEQNESFNKIYEILYKYK